MSDLERTPPGLQMVTVHYLSFAMAESAVRLRLTQPTSMGYCRRTKKLTNTIRRLVTC